MANLTKDDLLRLSRLCNEISEIFITAANRSEIAGDEVMLQEYLDKVIVGILRELSIPANYKGAGYLRDSIKLAVNDSNILKNITREVYPKVAEANGDTPTRVERSIRHAINEAWKRNNPEIAEKYFKNTLSGRKPTTSEFLFVISEYISLSMK